MNIGFLGDALDHWKGRVLEELQRCKVLQSLGVLAMITDDVRAWNQRRHRECYARLVAVHPSFITFDSFGSLADREAYFRNALPHAEDLFLDPDTGVRQGGGRRCVYPSEVELLLQRKKNRVVVVYQHKNRSVSCYEDKVALLTNGDTTCFCCDFGQVGMLFVSMDRSRLAAIRSELRKWLGGDPNERVGRFE